MRKSYHPVEGHFTHETDSPWPLHFEHSHWWRRRSRSKFATSHYAWGTNRVLCEMQDGCKVYMDFYMASNGSCFMVTWIVFKDHFLEVGLTQNWDIIGRPNVHNCWFILFYHVWRPAWIKKHSNCIWLRVRSRMASHYTWGSVTPLHDFWRCLGTAFGRFLWGSHNFMVTALGSCVKWP